MCDGCLSIQLGRLLSVVKCRGHGGGGGGEGKRVGERIYEQIAVCSSRVLKDVCSVLTWRIGIVWTVLTGSFD